MCDHNFLIFKLSFTETLKHAIRIAHELFDNPTDIREYIFPKNPPYQIPSRPTCMDYQLKPTELIFQNPTGSGSCPQGDLYLIHFDLMKPL